MISKRTFSQSKHISPGNGKTSNKQFQIWELLHARNQIQGNIMKPFYKNILAFALVAVICASVSDVFSHPSCTTEKNIISMARATIELFYKYKDRGDTNDLSNILDPPILSLLADKADAQQYVSNLYENAKQNYNIEIILLENIKIDLQACMKFQVITTFQYQKTPEIDTEVSEVVYVMYDYDKERITDIYTPDHFYDMAVRNLGTDATAESFGSLSASLSADIISRQNLLKGNIIKIYHSQLFWKAADHADSLPGSALDQAAVITYVRNNYNKAAPSSGNSTVPYYDFSQIPGNYDCTNFVSHALLAGGAHIYDTGGFGISSSGWYYRTLSNRSSSWSGVNQLYQYLMSNTVPYYPCGVCMEYSHHDGAWETGSILQFGSTLSNFYHSTIITEKTYSADGKKVYAYVTGRSSDIQYNNNQAVDDAAPNIQKRVISVYNR